MYSSNTSRSRRRRFPAPRWCSPASRTKKRPTISGPMSPRSTRTASRSEAPVWGSIRARVLDLIPSPCEFKQSVGLGALQVSAPRTPSAFVGDKRHSHPCRVEDESGQNDELARNRANRCAGPEIPERGNRNRMDEQFADVGSHLDRENPAIIVAEPAADGLGIGDVKVGRLVILVEDFVPAILDLHASAPEYRSEEVHFEHMRSHAPKIEKAVAAGLDGQESRNQEANENQRQRRRGLAAERQRQGDASCQHRPIGRGIKAG